MLVEPTAEVVSTRRDIRERAVRNPVHAAPPLRAVLFDLDGTLYRQQRLRALMALELAALALKQPRHAPVIWRVLTEFRRAQEELRGRQNERAADDQLAIAARRSSTPVTRVEAIVAEWMMERPLKYLAGCRAQGLVPLLDFLADRGLEVGVFSDYPAGPKLQALGVGGRFSVVLCSTDPDIGRFKPHPRGFLAACKRWQLDPTEVLVVGDRVDADAAGAAAAGMPCAIIGRSRSGRGGFISLSSLERLRDVLDDDHSH